MTTGERFAAFRDEALLLPGAALFASWGHHRPVREWVAVPADHADCRDGLAEVALLGRGER